MQDAAGDAQQFLFGHLEQFVARVGFDDILQALFIITALKTQRRRLMQHVLRFLADQRHLESRAIIGLAGEQANKTDLPGRLAVGAVAFNADIIHINPAMDTRLDIGLGDSHRLGIFKLGHQLLAKYRRFG